MTRKSKAIKYFKKLKSEQKIIKEKERLIYSLKNTQKAKTNSISAIAYEFIRKIQRRFPLSFTLQKYIDIAKRI